MPRWKTAAPKADEVITYLRYFPEEIEADLQRYYGIDIGDWWREEISSRRLLVLIEQLPGESATFRARNIGDRWNETQHILAYIADQITFARREAQGEDSTWNPQPLPRPNEGNLRQEEQEIMSTVHDGLLAMMSGGPPPPQSY